MGRGRFNGRGVGMVMLGGDDVVRSGDGSGVFRVGGATSTLARN